MKDLKIVPVTEQEQIAALAALADIIWHEHFTPIIGEAQVAYMLDKFQSERAITDMLSNQNYRYFFFEAGGQKVGYIGIQPREKLLFLSKIYLLKEHRGKGYARVGIDFLAQLCRKEGFDKIQLTCNRHNLNSIAAYQKMGFEIVYEQDADIGNGFVMNDYVMEKPIEG